ncbi:hypothetical protein J2Z66_007452 [Paenibacillus eucommiae]|uniref:Uncharacterized protein n=1 Tax=Paenibacillus eucommiae TaxID=1355755 RepID=A0ABS4J7J1_9BACL|nr:hypothetical protein [Paenibacillus eucommiae]
MQMDYLDGLLQASLTICYRGHSLTIDNLIIDTRGAFSSIF